MTAKKSASAPAAPEGQAALAPEQVDALRQAKKQADATDSAIKTAIDAWFADRIHNSPVSRNGDAYRHLHGELQSLAAAISAAVKKEI
jgi:hypothetical protein